MKWSKLAVALLATSMFVSCVSAATHTATNGEAAEVHLDAKDSKATVDIGTRVYRLTLLQIVDSRCPANAKCIWAGELAAQIAIEPTDQPREHREITLGESTVPSMEVSGLRLDLVEIDKSSVTFTVKAVEAR